MIVQDKLWLHVWVMIKATAYNNVPMLVQAHPTKYGISSSTAGN